MTELLKQCVEDYTQNANVSVNNIIWKFCHKKKNHGLVAANIALAMAVGFFNDGSVTFTIIMKELELCVGQFAWKCFEDKDIRRIVNARRQAKEATREARRARKHHRTRKDEELEEMEGFPYLAGGH